MVILRLLAFAPFLASAVASPLTSDIQNLHPGLVSGDNPGLLNYLNNVDPSDLHLTPGFGLPTLEELGWTMADFFDPAWRAAHGLPDPRTSTTRRFSSPLEERQIVGYCSADEGLKSNYGVIAGANCCADYLSGLGTQACVVNGATVNCNCGYLGYATIVTGNPAYGLSSASSACEDVGTSVHNIVATCPVYSACHDYSNTGTCATGGDDTASGNGNYIVTVGGDTYVA